MRSLSPRKREWRQQSEQPWQRILGRGSGPDGGCLGGDCTGEDWRGKAWYSPFDWRGGTWLSPFDGRQENKVPENVLQRNYGSRNTPRTVSIPRTVFLPQVVSFPWPPNSAGPRFFPTEGRYWWWTPRWPQGDTWFGGGDPGPGGGADDSGSGRGGGFNFPTDSRGFMPMSRDFMPMTTTPLPSPSGFSRTYSSFPFLLSSLSVGPDAQSGSGNCAKELWKRLMTGLDNDTPSGRDRAWKKANTNFWDQLFNKGGRSGSGNDAANSRYWLSKLKAGDPNMSDMIRDGESEQTDEVKAILQSKMGEAPLEQTTTKDHGGSGKSGRSRAKLGSSRFRRNAVNFGGSKTTSTSPLPPPLSPTVKTDKKNSTSNGTDSADDSKLANDGKPDPQETDEKIARASSWSRSPFINRNWPNLFTDRNHCNGIDPWIQQSGSNDLTRYDVGWTDWDAPSPDGGWPAAGVMEAWDDDQGTQPYSWNPLPASVPQWWSRTFPGQRWSTADSHDRQGWSRPEEEFADGRGGYFHPGGGAPENGRRNRGKRSANQQEDAREDDTVARWMSNANYEGYFPNRLNSFGNYDSFANGFDGYIGDNSYRPPWWHVWDSYNSWPQGNGWNSNLAWRDYGGHKSFFPGDFMFRSPSGKRPFEHPMGVEHSLYKRSADNQAKPETLEDKEKVSRWLENRNYRELSPRIDNYGFDNFINFNGYENRFSSFNSLRPPWWKMWTNYNSQPRGNEWNFNQMWKNNGGQDFFYPGIANLYPPSGNRGFGHPTGIQHGIYKRSAGKNHENIPGDEDEVARWMGNGNYGPVSSSQRRSFDNYNGFGSGLSSYTDFGRGPFNYDDVRPQWWNMWDNYNAWSQAAQWNSKQMWGNYGNRGSLFSGNINDFLRGGRLGFDGQRRRFKRGADNKDALKPHDKKEKVSKFVKTGIGRFFPSSNIYNNEFENFYNYNRFSKLNNYKLPHYFSNDANRLNSFNTYRPNWWKMWNNDNSWPGGNRWNLDQMWTQLGDQSPFFPRDSKYFLRGGRYGLSGLTNGQHAVFRRSVDDQDYDGRNRVSTMMNDFGWKCRQWWNTWNDYSCWLAYLNAWNRNNNNRMWNSHDPFYLATDGRQEDLQKEHVLSKRSTVALDKDRTPKAMGGYGGYWPPWWNMWNNYRYWPGWNTRNNVWRWNDQGSYYPHHYLQRGQSPVNQNIRSRRSAEEKNAKGEEVSRMMGGYDGNWLPWLFSYRYWPAGYWNSWNRNNYDWMWNSHPPFYFAQNGNEQHLEKEHIMSKRSAGEKEEDEVSRMLSDFGGSWPQWENTRSSYTHWPQWKNLMWNNNWNWNDNRNWNSKWNWNNNQNWNNKRMWSRFNRFFPFSSGQFFQGPQQLRDRHSTVKRSAEQKEKTGSSVEKERAAKMMSDYGNSHQPQWWNSWNNHERRHWPGYWNTNWMQNRPGWTDNWMWNSYVPGRSDMWMLNRYWPGRTNNWMRSSNQGSFPHNFFDNSKSGSQSPPLSDNSQQPPIWTAMTGMENFLSSPFFAFSRDEDTESKTSKEPLAEHRKKRSSEPAEESTDGNKSGKTSSTDDADSGSQPDVARQMNGYGGSPGKMYQQQLWRLYRPYLESRPMYLRGGFYGNIYGDPYGSVNRNRFQNLYRSHCYAQYRMPWWSSPYLYTQMWNDRMWSWMWNWNWNRNNPTWNYYHLFCPYFYFRSGGMPLSRPSTRRGTGNTETPEGGASTRLQTEDTKTPEEDPATRLQTGSTETSDGDIFIRRQTQNTETLEETENETHQGAATTPSKKLRVKRSIGNTDYPYDWGGKFYDNNNYNDWPSRWRYGEYNYNPWPWWYHYIKSPARNNYDWNVNNYDWNVNNYDWNVNNYDWNVNNYDWSNNWNSYNRKNNWNNRNWNSHPDRNNNYNWMWSGYNSRPVMYSHGDSSSTGTTAQHKAGSLPLEDQEKEATETTDRSKRSAQDDRPDPNILKWRDAYRQGFYQPMWQSKFWNNRMPSWLEGSRWYGGQDQTSSNNFRPWFIDRRGWNRNAMRGMGTGMNLWNGNRNLFSAWNNWGDLRPFSFSKESEDTDTQAAKDRRKRGAGEATPRESQRSSDPKVSRWMGGYSPLTRMGEYFPLTSNPWPTSRGRKWQIRGRNSLQQWITWNSMGGSQPWNKWNSGFRVPFFPFSFYASDDKSDTADKVRQKRSSDDSTVDLTDGTTAEAEEEDLKVSRLGGGFGPMNMYPTGWSKYRPSFFNNPMWMRYSWPMFQPYYNYRQWLSDGNRWNPHKYGPRWVLNQYDPFWNQYQNDPSWVWRYGDHIQNANSWKIFSEESNWLNQFMDNYVKESVFDPVSSYYFSQRQEDAANHDAELKERSTADKSTSAGERVAKQEDDSRPKRSVVNLVKVLSRGQAQPESRRSNMAAVNMVGKRFAKRSVPYKLKRFSSEATARLQRRFQKRSPASTPDSSPNENSSTNSDIAPELTMRATAPASGQNARDWRPPSGSGFPQNLNANPRNRNRNENLNQNSNPRQSQHSDSGQARNPFGNVGGVNVWSRNQPGKIDRNPFGELGPGPAAFGLNGENTGSLNGGGNSKGSGSNSHIDNIMHEHSNDRVSGYTYVDHKNPNYWKNVPSPDSFDSSARGPLRNSSWNDWLGLWVYGPNVWDDVGDADFWEAPWDQGLWGQGLVGQGPSGQGPWGQGLEGPGPWSVSLDRGQGGGDTWWPSLDTYYNSVPTEMGWEFQGLDDCDDTQYADWSYVGYGYAPWNWNRRDWWNRQDLWNPDWSMDNVSPGGGRRDCFFPHSHPYRLYRAFSRPGYNFVRPSSFSFHPNHYPFGPCLGSSRTFLFRPSPKPVDLLTNGWYGGRGQPDIGANRWGTWGQNAHSPRFNWPWTINWGFQRGDFPWLSWNPNSLFEPWRYRVQYHGNLEGKVSRSRRSAPTTVNKRSATTAVNNLAPASTVVTNSPPPSTVVSKRSAPPSDNSLALTSAAITKRSARSLVNSVAPASTAVNKKKSPVGSFGPSSLVNIPGLVTPRRSLSSGEPLSPYPWILPNYFYDNNNNNGMKIWKVNSNPATRGGPDLMTGGWPRPSWWDTNN